MSESKTIQFNPELFKVSGGNKTRKQNKNKGKEIKYKNNNIHNKTTKNKLLKYIREQQELRYKKLFDNNDNLTNNENTNQLVNDENNIFENSVNYLKSVSDKYQQNHNQPTQPTHINTKVTNPIHNTIKHRPSILNAYLPNSGLINTISPIIHTELPDNFTQQIDEPTDKSNIKLSTRYNLPPPPKWGCLRNGNLQTYREFMKNQTQRNRYNAPSIISRQPLAQTVTTSSPININNQKREVMIIKKNIEKQNRINGAQSNNKLKYLKQKKVIRRTYKVGKSKYQPEVSILISNKTIRNNITTKTHMLKQVPIQEVKQYLINKGLIRVGTISPNDVLRMMYESSILVGGDIQNHNSENLLYNYFTKNE